MSPVVAADRDTTRARQAARALFNDPETRQAIHEPAGPTQSAAAVDELAALFTNGPGTYKMMLRRSRDFAGLLSSDRLQGLAEIIQNADDVRATEVTFQLSGNSLTASHNGIPARLRDIHALAAPWLSTKSDDEELTGRFGIGLSTLHALADAFDFHSGDYHVRLGAPTITAIDGAADPAFSTTLALSLRAGEIAAGDLLRWADDWDDASLLFLRYVRTITFSDHDEHRTLHLSERKMPPVQHAIAGELRTVHRAILSAPDGRRWDVERANPPAPPGLQRAYKATSTTTSIAVALPQQASDGRGFVAARLPLAPLEAPAFLNAEFDPTVGRQGIAANPWNRAVASLVIELWTQATLDELATHPRAAWNAIPTSDPDLAAPQEPVIQLQRHLTHEATALVGFAARIPIGGTFAPLGDIAAEDATLTGLLTDPETALLAGTPHTLPSTARDQENRWRQVLAAWKALGVASPKLVTPATALTLAATLDDIGRAKALVSAAIHARADDRLRQVAWVQLATGERIPPPSRGDLPILTTDPTNLAIALSIGQQVTYGPNDDTAVDWLTRNSTLGSELSDQTVLEHLSRLGSRRPATPLRLSDEDLSRLRTALEDTSPTDRQRLGPGIGQAIQLDAIRYTASGSREQLSRRPADAYIPSAIDKDIDSFASAARKAPGPVWINPRYLELLHSAHGREGFGARAMLTTLGSRMLPTFAPHPGREPLHGSSRGLAARTYGSPRPRTQALDAIQGGYHYLATLDDQHSPELDAVLDDIAREASPALRRRRAHALLATLTRLWPQEGGRAHVQAGDGHYTWRSIGTEVPSWWLARIQDVPWLDDEAGSPRRPIELRQPTPTNRAAYGDAAGLFVHPELNEPRFADLLHEIGVPGEPPTEDFIERLRKLRQQDRTDEVAYRQTADVYRAIAARLHGTPGARRTFAIDMRWLRREFATHALLLTSAGWRAPTDAFRGDPIFGPYRAFAPKVPEAEPLWSALHIPEPSATDGLAVLRELAKSDPPRLEDESVHLEVLRLLNRLIPGPRAAGLASALRRAPLRTTQGWTTKRPVYAIDDPAIVTSIGPRLPLWLPGGKLPQFPQLLGLLRITGMPQPQLAPSTLRDEHENEDRTTDFRSAIEHLRDDLARNETELHGSIQIPWDDLAGYGLLVSPNLAVDVSIPGGDPAQLRAEVPAHLDRDQRLLRLRTVDSLDDPDGAGRAIAGLFAHDARAVTYAWLVAVRAARRDPQLAMAMRTAAELAEGQADAFRTTTPSEPDTLQLMQAERQQHREHRPSVTTRTAGQTPSAGRAEASAARVLVDIADLELTDPSGQIVPAVAAPPFHATPRRAPSELPTPALGGATPQQHTTAPAYTDLDKETLGRDLLRWVLASDEDEIVDLRAQRHVGADAIDELHRYYELKVYARDEPDTIRLEGSERRKALAVGSDFFLVVISGVEGADATPKVRIIDHPLEQLALSERSVIEYSGVRRTHSLLFNTRRKASQPDT